MQVEVPGGGGGGLSERLFPPSLITIGTYFMLSLTRSNNFASILECFPFLRKVNVLHFACKVYVQLSLPVSELGNKGRGVARLKPLLIRRRFLFQISQGRRHLLRII